MNSESHQRHGRSPETRNSIRLRFRLKGKTFELQRSGADPSVWFVVDTAKKSEEPLAVVLTYVDDFLMTGPPEILQGVLTEIQKVWTLGAQKVVKSKAGEQNVFLGREIRMSIS